MDPTSHFARTAGTSERDKRHWPQPRGACVIASAVVVALSTACSARTPGCDASSPTMIPTWTPEAPASVDRDVQLDDRYSPEIRFAKLGFAWPLPDRAFVRSEGFVDDLELTQSNLLAELGVADANVVHANPGPSTARTTVFRFRDGTEVGVVWALHADDLRVQDARMAHELYHALARLDPRGVSHLHARICELGYELDWSQVDHESAATIVEVLTLHMHDVPLESIAGSAQIDRARAALQAAARAGE